MDSLDGAALDELIADIGSSHRPWALPLLRVIEEAGGAVSPTEARVGIRRLVEGTLTPGQIQYLEDNNRLGWVKFVLRKRGFLEGERGVWRLTDRGRDYLEQHRNDLLSIPTDSPDAADAPSKEATDETGMETVPVSPQPAFEIPILQALAFGLRQKQEVFEKVHELMKESLLPGDHRVMKGGKLVWKYRASWCLTRIHREGLVRNSGSGQWEITEAGLKRLELEKATWKIENFGTARSTVRVESGGEPPGSGPTKSEPAPDWNASRWQELRTRIPKDVFDALDARLRLTAGPGGNETVARNVILYGPPGTGKTFIAKEVAQAITGQGDPGDDPLWRLVQFHPSYAYEDFVQGMRPDLERDELRYTLAEGPFLEFCQTAADDPDRFYVMIIDEINRGDPARIFGELLYALEYRDAPVDLALGGQLTVPSNLIVIGTMNSVDRSVALVDYALRRRFGFVRVLPDSELVATLRKGQPFGQTAARALYSLNDWIKDRLSLEHQVGHSFFLSSSTPLDSLDSLQAIWSLDIRPLLEEYFFGDQDSLKEAESQWMSGIAQASADSEDEAGEAVNESSMADAS